MEGAEPAETRNRQDGHRHTCPGHRAGQERSTARGTPAPWGCRPASLAPARLLPAAPRHTPPRRVPGKPKVQAEPARTLPPPQPDLALLSPLCRLLVTPLPLLPWAGQALAPAPGPLHVLSRPPAVHLPPQFPGAAPSGAPCCPPCHLPREAFLTTPGQNQGSTSHPPATAPTSPGPLIPGLPVDRSRALSTAHFIPPHLLAPRPAPPAPAARPAAPGLPHVTAKGRDGGRGDRQAHCPRVGPTASGRSQSQLSPGRG